MSNTPQRLQICKIYLLHCHPKQWFNSREFFILNLRLFKTSRMKWVFKKGKNLEEDKFPTGSLETNSANKSMMIQLFQSF